jgi:hypothetical protein
MGVLPCTDSRGEQACTGSVPRVEFRQVLAAGVLVARGGAADLSTKALAGLYEYQLASSLQTQGALSCTGSMERCERFQNVHVVLQHAYRIVACSLRASPACQ